jgi:hypothetical protein
MKKATCDQLPHLESDGTVELGYRKMANGPEREPGEQLRTGYRFKRENDDVYADQQSSESRHKNRLTACAQFHTKFTKGSRRTQCYGDLAYHKNWCRVVRIPYLIIAREAPATAAVKNCIGRCSRIPQAFSS